MQIDAWIRFSKALIEIFYYFLIIASRQIFGINKIAMEIISKIYRSDLTLNCRSRHLCIKSAHTALTYLNVHNNPINGFQPAATHPSSRLSFLHAYANWSHQSMAGPSRFGPSNGYKIILFTHFCRSPHQIPIPLERPPPYERHNRASATAEY